MITLNHYLWASGLLFVIGLIGVVTRRNIIMLLLAIEILFNAANLALVAFAAHRGDLAGQVIVFFVMIVAAAEITVGLAIAVLMVRRLDTAEADKLSLLKW